ncbi:MBL fold metallo-hydrolase [Paucisalibacillus sp. EB02]|uniref:MBL fold metallo-hydrolase n=1 Tax=Paucisalibacillus sp. EB02 TaxID=1347087 RepID=UPI0004B20E41|nr:MBL fold metallo-hydrolase [Paucisalibacillus sp. EB02]
MKIKSFSLGPLGTNCYILHKGDKSIIVDPGAEGEKVKRWLSNNNLQPIAILLTHAHFDHIGAVDFLRNYYGIRVYMHKEEKSWLGNPSLNGSILLVGEEITITEPDVLVEPGPFSIEAFQFEVIHTPGHSPGSISFLVVGEKMLISGDVLFQRGIGRTDLPGGNYKFIQDSIRNKLYHLAEETIIYPGHGPVTTIGEEKLLNPFVPEL